MGNYEIVFYRSPRGDCPFETFLEGMDAKPRAKMFDLLDLLSDQGPDLKRPYADVLRDGIRVPSGEIERALRYRDDYTRRHPHG